MINSASLEAGVLAANYATSAVISADVDLIADSATHLGTGNGALARAGGPCRRIMVGTGGNVTFKPVAGPTVCTAYSIPDGGSIDIQATKIYQTGTTAIKMLVLW
jgi:hypothetical protein